MANVYLIDQPAGGAAVDLATRDSDAAVVLIQDGVYLDVSALKKAGRPLYAVKRDVDKRGLSNRLDGVKAIGFDGLVDLIMANKVVNFA